MKKPTEEQLKKTLDVIERANEAKKHQEKMGENISDNPILKLNLNDEQAAIVALLAEQVYEEDQKLEWINLGTYENMGASSKEEAKEAIQRILDKISLIDEFKIENENFMVGLKPSNMRMIQSTIKEVGLDLNDI